MCDCKVDISKGEWDTKEDTGKSMKNTMYVLQHVKGTSQDIQW